MLFYLFFILILFITIFIPFSNENYKNIKDNKPYLWIYWDNLTTSEDPPIIKLCYKTVRKHCSNDFNIVRLNKDNITKYLPELMNYKDYFSNLKIAHKVDIYRIMLLYKYGGLYLDSDIVIMNNLKEVIKKLNDYDYVGFGCTGKECKYGNNYGRPSNWAIGAKKNSILMKNILDRQINYLIMNKNINDYHAIGKKLIWDELFNLKNSGYIYYHFPIHRDGSRDINGSFINTKKLFSENEIIYQDKEKLLFIVFYNSQYKDIKKMSEKEISKYQIGKLIETSLKK